MSVEQVADSVGSDVEFDGKGGAPGNTRQINVAGHRLMQIGASSGNTRQCIWLVTEYCWNIEPEKYWEGAKRKISTVCFASFSKLPVVCVMLLLKGDR